MFVSVFAVAGRVRFRVPIAAMPVPRRERLTEFGENPLCSKIEIFGITKGFAFRTNWTENEGPRSVRGF